ncbi:hypothetical protein TrLO_g956 [Triparma laevis f. longispina]|uniref:CAAX prenyl protease 2/Lysostaphin resistance protein A-like domain-containing protein n=1 Tax=Triparma laevis f. longispina TaxID=1714387 RepID=A0A9W7FUA8_9STRA|nr:hypothetical protein TrLO_g956 [Triparma laevis f. longispina]
MRSILLVACTLLSTLHVASPFTPYLTPGVHRPSLKHTRRSHLVPPPSPFLHPTIATTTKLLSTPTPPTSPEPDEYNAKTTSLLIVGQALFIPLAALISFIIPKLHIFSATNLTPLTSPAFLDVAYKGILYTIPLGIFVLLTSSLEKKIPALKQVAMATESTILSLLGSTPRLFTSILFGCLLGAVAGLGEELLFRGCIQTSLSTYLPAPLSLSLTSLLFALGHAITPLYALISFIASLYFGWVFNSTGDLMIPIIAHGLYDAVAVVATHYIVTTKTREERDELRSSFFGLQPPPSPPPNP